jgi:hypothetical protein
MAEIINLRRARKSKARQASEKIADANRIAHGAPKQDRLLAKARASKHQHDIDAHRLNSNKDEPTS